ncbi:MAG: RdgB/HAM1 family non-canonical purine NTP pyrophosphatase [Cyclobacteriaceae bacterium]
MELYFATRNQNKVKEIQALLPDNIIIKSISELTEEDIIEDGDTLEANASIKSRFIYNQFKVACFADDTGLEIDALDGAPGVRSARYAGEHCDSNDNIDLVLSQLEGQDNRNARFRTIISFIDNNGNEVLLEGEAKGQITRERFGEGGFGYDPIFLPKGKTSTFAEMSLAGKNKISHRGKAIEKLIDFLISNYG